MNETKIKIKVKVEIIIAIMAKVKIGAPITACSSFSWEIWPEKLLKIKGTD